MIPVNKPKFFGNEKKYLVECIKSSWVSSEGPFVKKFEKNLAVYMNRKFGTAVSSGTAALEIAVKSLNLKTGDEVIVPSFTIISCLQAITNAKLKPVFVDCEYRTFNTNLFEIKKKITNKTKAIIIVHTYGLTVDLKEIIKFCKKRKIKIIEDAAEVIGQEYKGSKCGSFGDISILSFYANKHINTGEGGMILTNNQIYKERFERLRNLNFQKKSRFIHNDFGFNYRMTNLQAAIGLGQLEKISEIVRLKRKIGKNYNNLLKDIMNIYLPIDDNGNSKNIYWVYPIILKKNCKFTSKNIIKKLATKGIQCRPFFYPLHKQPALKKIKNYKFNFNKKDYANSEHLYRKGFYIPSGLSLTFNDQYKVSIELKKILNR